MTGKQRLECILNGRIPDAPPHWELVFQIETRIRDSVRYCMTHGGIGKPYIFSTSNCIFNGMPPASYRIMLDEYKRLCKRE
jgi:hypothetical protein